MNNLIGQKAEEFVRWLRNTPNLPGMTIDEAVTMWEKESKNKEVIEHETTAKGS